MPAFEDRALVVCPSPPGWICKVDGRLDLGAEQSALRALMERKACTLVRELAVRQMHPVEVLLPDGLPAFLKLLAEPNRLRILVLLARGEQCVCDIEAALGLPQNLVSHHLSVLKRAGLLLDRRAGKWIYYRIEPQTLGEQLGALTAVLDTRHARHQAVPCPEDGPSHGRPIGGDR